MLSQERMFQEVDFMLTLNIPYRIVSYLWACRKLYWGSSKRI